DNNWFYWNNEKKLMSGSNDEENPYCEIDRTLVFWRNGVPSLEFTETEVITYQGKNLMKMRSDLETVELWVYILNYYRMLTPDTIQRNIKNMTREDIKKLYAERNRSKCNIEENHQNKFSTIDLLANAFLHIYR
ncbi:hypothetical protein ACFFRR_007761, partial [Megaselia abdita]